MQKIIWQVEYLSSIPVIRYCNKCRKKTRFNSSGQFRVNSHQKNLDIWLIYHCTDCNTSWNLPIVSNFNIKSINQKKLELFLNNDSSLAECYAMDIGLLHKNGLETELPDYQIKKEKTVYDSLIQLSIKSKYPSQIKLETILRTQLLLTKKEYCQLIECETIKSIMGADLRKGRLQKENFLILQNMGRII